MFDFEKSLLYICVILCFKDGDHVELSDSNTDISIIHPILSRDARTALSKSPYPKTSHTEPLVKTDNQAQDLLKAFLSRVEHRVF